MKVGVMVGENVGSSRDNTGVVEHGEMSDTASWQVSAGVAGGFSVDNKGARDEWGGVFGEESGDSGMLFVARDNRVLSKESQQVYQNFNQHLETIVWRILQKSLTYRN